MPKPQNQDPYERISSALDRFQEAHFWIHTLESHYHDADPFRWHLNAFLKAVKEVPQLVAMELQHESGFSDWFRERRTALNNDELMSALSKGRDFIVHRGMLVPNSRAQIGITEGKGMKLGMTFPIHPLEDSEHAMDRYLIHAAEQGDFLGILMHDDDSMPCVYRQWNLEGFDKEIVDLCAEAWFKLGALLKDVLQRIGVENVGELSLSCRHSTQGGRYHLFDRDKLIKKWAELKGGHNQPQA